jgi:protoporphyrinogen oxidase
LVDSFYYPQFGSGTIYEAIKDRLQTGGSMLQFQASPSRISWSGTTVTGVEVVDSQGSSHHAPTAVVSSVPASEIVQMFDPPAPSEVLAAAASLRFRAQRYVFLTLNRTSVSKDNWIYFPDKTVPFGRIAEMKNFSTDLCPEGKTSLFVEYFCFTSDALWTMSNNALQALTVEWLEKLGLISAHDVQSAHFYQLEHVYPVYDREYKQRLHTLMSWLDRFDNFFAVGRPGRFRYTNQDHSLEMGILAAQSILDGRRHAIEDVGAEKEYFERGYVPQEKA